MDLPFPKSKKRLGPDDRRLQVRRCVSCRTGHRKCDSNRPCSGCIIRKITCKDDSKGRTEFPLVSVSPQSKLEERVEEDWSYYIDGCFELIGNGSHLPIPLEALSRQSLSEYLFPGNENPVWHGAIAVGAAFRTFQRRNGPVGGKSRSTSIASSAAERAKTLIGASQSPGNTGSGLSSIIAALLINIYLLMTDNTSIQVVSWKENTVQPLVRQWFREDIADQSMKPLVRTLWMFGCVYAFEFDLDPQFGDNKWFPHGEDDHVLWSGSVWKQKNHKELLTQATDYLLPRFAQLVRLNAQSVSLRHHRHDGTAYPPLSPLKSFRFGDDIQTDRDLTIESTDFDIMARWNEVNSLSQSLEKLSLALDDAFEDVIAQTSSKLPMQLPPCSQGSICLLKNYADLSRLVLSRLFVDSNSAERPANGPSNGNTPCPMLPQNVANTRILSSLCMLEERLLHDGRSPTANDTSTTTETTSNIGVELILYFPILSVIALEVRCVELRRRVRVLFGTIQSRGLIVAQAALQDFELAWGATASGCGDFCFCGTTI